MVRFINLFKYMNNFRFININNLIISYASSNKSQKVYVEQTIVQKVDDNGRDTHRLSDAL